MKPILLFLLTCAMWGQAGNSWDRKNFDGVPTEMADKVKDIALCRQWRMNSTCQNSEAVILVCPAGYRVMYDWQLHHAATTDGQVIWQTVGYPWPECMDEAKAKERLRDFYASAAPKPAVSSVNAEQSNTWSCPGSGCASVTHETPPKSEPMDVPSVKGMKWLAADCNSSQNGVSTLMVCLPGYQKQFEVDTCADKRRILLTDEAGNKHCILFSTDSGRTKEK